MKKSKRKASVADLEEGQRKSSRQKTTLGGRKVGEASEAIEAYKRQREKKGRRDELRRRDMAAGEAAPVKDEAPSDKDAEGESEVEWDNRERSPSPPRMTRLRTFVIFNVLAWDVPISHKFASILDSTKPFPGAMLE